MDENTTDTDSLTLVISAKSLSRDVFDMLAFCVSKTGCIPLYFARAKILHKLLPANASTKEITI